MSRTSPMLMTTAFKYGLCRACALGALSVAIAGGRLIAAPLGQADFLKTDGPVIRANSGIGSVVTLRGTNIGGWLMQEDWMSPNGYGIVTREGWTASSPNAGSTAAVLDGDIRTAWQMPAGGAGDQILELSFGRPVAFRRIALATGDPEDGTPGELLFQVSMDGRNWKPVRSERIEATAGESLVCLDDVYTARHLRIRRGVGVACTLALAEVNLYQNDDFTVRMALRRRFGTAIADELFDCYQEAWFTADDLDNIKSWGMNVVRVPMNWLEFVEPDGTWKSGRWKELDWVIKECGERGLYVILDMHAVPGGASPWASSGRAGDDGTGQNPNGFWTDPGFQDLTVEIWTHIAKRYRGNPAVAGYDLINEPLYRFDELPRPGERHSEAALHKGALFDRLYRAVRAVDPDHIIFIAAYTVAPPANTAHIGTPSGFLGITPPSHHGWTNVVYETHHYDMPNAQDRAAQERLVIESLADIARHQREWNVAVFAGEYSLYGHYDVWERWMTGLNRLNVSWTNWTYKIRGTAGDPAGVDWGFFHTNRNPIPDMNRDSAANIAAKWKRFGTAEFTRNDRLIEVVSRCTKAARTDSPQALRGFVTPGGGEGSVRAGSAATAAGPPVSFWQVVLLGTR